MVFTKEDEKIIADKGIQQASIEQDLDRFKNGYSPIDLNRPATIGDGIFQLSLGDQKRLENLYAGYEGKVQKFVPASGAASRMFKELQEFRNNYTGGQGAYDELISNSNNPVFNFFKQLDSFAFYSELKKSFEEHNEITLEEAHLSRRYLEILKVLMDESGMNYSQLPKGLLKFHDYDGLAKTPLEEQIVEGWSHRVGKELEIQFTVSPNHLSEFEANVEKVLARLEFGSAVQVSFSFQKSSTDIIAVDGSNNPFRDQLGNLLFRPAGHGALLENLAELDADLVFIKNIDNILPDHFKDISVHWKKLLAGKLIETQNTVFDLLDRNENGEDITEEALKVLPLLGIAGETPREQVVELLNRPIRVCGMVKNEGEPGGGPFWINTDGRETLQIVESAQVDLSNGDQLEKLNSSTHFNPVDLVCGVKNFKGEKFDLLKYRDFEQGFISAKSYQGRELKAMELPGLWNGSMADWNTLFVEVPVETFSPVKGINDLLKEEHQPANSSTN